MNKLFKYKTPLLLFILSICVHLVGSLFAQNTEADATSRVLVAEELIHDFRIIYSGHWPSLHYYFLSFFIWLFNDRVVGPMVLSMLMGTIAVIPFYGFCKNLFSRKGAVFAALVFIVCPVILRLSFIPLSEIYYLCFTCFCLYYLSEVWCKDERKISNALIAGFFLTLAGGMRIEAWILIPILCIPFLLLKDIKSAFFFCLSASVFPVFWMIGNFIDFNDVFYSIHSVENWNFKAEGHNDNIDKTEVLRRLLFYPVSVILMLTPVGVIVITFYLLKYTLKRKFSNLQLGMFLVLAAMSVIYELQCINGRLFMQHRFTITLMLFTIPFFALVFQSDKLYRIKIIIASFLITAMIPFSFFWHNLVSFKMFAVNERVNNTFNIIIADSFHQIAAVPTIEDDRIVEIKNYVNNVIKEEDGWIIDFDCWESTYFLGSAVRADYDRIYIQQGAKASVFDIPGLLKFAKSNPTGLILLKDYGSLENNVLLPLNLLAINESSGFELNKEKYFGHLRLFRYKLIEGESYLALKSKNPLEPVYHKMKDLEYTKDLIRRDSKWFADIIQKAYERSLTIEDMLTIDAEYLLKGKSE